MSAKFQTREEIPADADVNVCAECGRDFVPPPKNPGKQFCSNACGGAQGAKARDYGAPGERVKRWKAGF